MIVARRAGLPDGKAARLVLTRLLAEMRGALLDRRPVRLTKIGTLVPYNKKATSYRHPTSGELMQVDERLYLKLNVSLDMKEAMAEVV